MQRHILRDMLRLMDERVPFAVATVIRAQGSVPGKEGARMLVTAEGATLGTVGGAGLERQVIAQARECIRAGRNGVFPYTLWRESPDGLDSICGGKVEVHVEFVRPKPHLLICGGGHVGYETGRLCGPLDYTFSVYDERPEFASRERFPEAAELHHGDPAVVFGSLPVQRFSHVIVSGHSYHVDLELLRRLLPRFAGYVGVIGSSKKKQTMLDELRKAGIGEEALARIECPIGVRIGAVTPAEIAVSIMGSVIRTQAVSPAGERETPDAAGARGRDE